MTWEDEALYHATAVILPRSNSTSGSVWYIFHETLRTELTTRTVCNIIFSICSSKQLALTAALITLRREDLCATTEV